MSAYQGGFVVGTGYYLDGGRFLLALHAPGLSCNRSCSPRSSPSKTRSESPKSWRAREWVYFAGRFQREGLRTTVRTFSRADLGAGGLGDMFDNLIADLIGERSAREALSRGM